MYSNILALYDFMGYEKNPKTLIWWSFLIRMYFVSSLKQDTLECGIEILIGFCLNELSHC